MKFSPEHYQSLKSSIEALNLDLLKLQDLYMKSTVAKDPKVRFVWDIFWASAWSKNNREASLLYNDKHIETATRKAIKELS